MSRAILAVSQIDNPTRSRSRPLAQRRRRVLGNRLVRKERFVSWLIVVVAGLFEVGMALSLKESDGFSRLWPSVLFGVTGVISFLLLSVALKSLPVGTAYAVWTGIGAAGTAVLGIVLLDEPRDLARVAGIVMIIGGVVALRLAGE